jgi:hypothetical protein
MTIAMTPPAPPAAIAAPDDDPSDWRMLATLGMEAALGVAAAAAEACPGDGDLRMVLGRALLACGRHGEAGAALEQAMALGCSVEVLDMLAAARYPGPRYRDHLDALHLWLKPRIYLEIGVFKGDTIALARPGTRAIGVDPAPLAQADRAYGAPTALHRLTSDAYFASVAAGDIASPEPVDLAFIDGLHLFEQVLRDFTNVERHAHRGTVAVLHDTLPVAQAAATRHRATRHWCGDVWKIVPCLRRFRPDLALLTIPTHPSGLTLVTGLDRHAALSPARIEEAVAAFAGADWPAAWAGRGGGFDVAVENRADHVRAWLCRARGLADQSA